MYVLCQPREDMLMCYLSTTRGPSCHVEIYNGNNLNKYNGMQISLNMSFKELIELFLWQFPV